MLSAIYGTGSFPCSNIELVLVIKKVTNLNLIYFCQLFKDKVTGKNDRS